MAACLEIVNESKLSEDRSNDLPPELLLQFQNVNIKENKMDERDIIVVPDWMKHFASPFLWHSESKRGDSSEVVIGKTLDKIEELKLEEPDLTLQHFVLLLKLVLEYYVLNDMENAWSSMKRAQDEFEKVVNDASEECECKDFVMTLGHVISATKAHLLMLDGDEEQSKKIGKIIIPIKVMPPKEQAAVWAMKARFFLYSGYENGETIGVESAKQALEMDPENAEWSYLVAKLLRQQRKETPFSVEVPKEELILLEKAVAKVKSEKYLIYLAQVYMECGTKAFKQHRFQPGFYNSPLNQAIENMHKQALRLYKEALELKPQSPSVLRRIGYGVMNLPKKIADYTLALDCLEKSQKICSNNITLHMLGTYYHRYASDNKKALEFFERIAKEEVNAGLCDMIRVKFIEDPEYNPCKDLEWGLTWKQKQKSRSLLLVQLGAYYLFVKRDLLQSIPYFNQVMEEDKYSIHMKTFKSFFLRMYEPIDLYEYITNEAKLLLQNAGASKPEESLESYSAEKYTITKIGCVEDLIFKISEVRPELMEMEADSSLVDTLIQTSNNNAQREKNRNQNRNRSGERNINRGVGGNQRGRGGPYTNQRGRGFRRGGREGYQQRTTDGDNSERRGRFSLANQRDNTADKEFETETSGKSFSQNHPNRNHHSNWRQRQDKDNLTDENLA